MPNEWIDRQIQQLMRGIEFMETGRVGAACDITPGQSWAEREAADAKATNEKIAEDRKTIAELEALHTHA